MARVRIPGYTGYYIELDTGHVYNSEGHRLKPIPSKQGLKVELRRPGLRERLLIEDLVRRVAYENCGSVRADNSSTEKDGSGEAREIFPE